jgi:hypothetical protein
MTRVGDQITVVGKVTDTYISVGQVTTTTFINFGDYRDGDFTIVAFGRLSHELEAAFGENAEALRGSWVTLSGMVTQYQGRWSDVPTPQIELERVQTLRVLSETDARVLLAPPPQPETPPAPQPKPGSPEETAAPTSGVYRLKAPPKPTPNPMVDHLARRLDQRYSSSSFRPTPPPPPRAPTRPPPQYWPPPAPPPPSVWPPARTRWWQRLLDRLRR